jgi:hypothetical protein
MLHPALGARTNVMDGLDEQIDQIIGQYPAAQMDVDREPGKPGRLRMAAQLIGGFCRNTRCRYRSSSWGSTLSNRSGGSAISRASFNLDSAS